jgi:hypothetical protein
LLGLVSLLSFAVVADMAGAKPRGGEADGLPATTFGYIHPRRRSGGGNVEIGSIDFQGLWEGWKKTVSPFFPGFPADRHFHGLLSPALAFGPCLS